MSYHINGRIVRYTSCFSPHFANVCFSSGIKCCRSSNIEPWIEGQVLLSRLFPDIFLPLRFRQCCWLMSFPVLIIVIEKGSYFHTFGEHCLECWDLIYGHVCTGNTSMGWCLEVQFSPMKRCINYKLCHAVKITVVISHACSFMGLWGRHGCWLEAIKNQNCEVTRGLKFQNLKISKSLAFKISKLVSMIVSITIDGLWN